MKENNIDDILTLAFANLHQPEPPEAFKNAIARQPRAPLAQLIDGLLEEQPGIGVRLLLKRIADLNQGSPEDMDRMDFQSYLIGRLGVSESELRQCMTALGSYRRLCEAHPGEQFLAAARDECGEGIGSIDADQLRALFKKRKK
jgi:hypothetical protein